MNDFDERLAGWSPSSTAVFFSGSPSWRVVRSFSVPVFASVQMTTLRPQRLRLLQMVLYHPIFFARTAVATRRLRVALAVMAWLPTAWAMRIERVEFREAARPARPRRARRLPRRLRTHRRQPVGSSPEKRLSISGLVLAQDEASVIGTALDSMEPVCSQVVVVDGGSKDETIRVAAARGALVIERRFDDDFATQRNVGLAAADGAWAIVVDADEWLSPGTDELCRRFVESDLGDSVYLTRLNRVAGEADPAHWPSPRLTMFRAGLRYVGRVHEQVAGWRRPLYGPLSGPFIVHDSTPLRLYRSALHWSRINSEEHDETTLRWLQEQIALLERDADAEGGS